MGKTVKFLKSGHIKKGERLPHGYEIVEGYETKEHKGIHLPKNKRLKHGYQKQKGKRNKFYKHGGIIPGII